MRSSFTSKFRFYADDPTIETDVAWFRVSWDDPALGVTTQWSSSIWDDGKWFGLPGEINASRVWSPGAPPRIRPIGPPGLCGTAAQWYGPFLTTDPPPQINPATGNPFCCGQTVLQTEVAEAIAADSEFLPVLTPGPAIAYASISTDRPSFDAGAAEAYGVGVLLSIPMQDSAPEVYHGPGAERVIVPGQVAEVWAAGATAVQSQAPGAAIAEAAAALLVPGRFGLPAIATGLSAFWNPGHPTGDSALLWACGSVVIIPGGMVWACDAVLTVGPGPAGAGEVWAATGTAVESHSPAAGEAWSADWVAVTITAAAAADAYACDSAVHVSSGVSTTFCSVPVNTTLTATCTAASAGLSAFLGVVVTLTYNGSFTRWDGSVTISGNAGTFHFGAGTPNTTCNLNGSSTAGGAWSVTGPLMGVTPSCGPPINVVYTSLQSAWGLTPGTTSWTVAG